jgi:type I restriction enzyme R subunit
VKHQDCAAHLIGYIRPQTLGCPLIPFEDRVNKAVVRIRSKSNFQWTENPVRWLDRIAKQIKKLALVDEETLNTGAYAPQGGFNQTNKTNKIVP